MLPGMRERRWGRVIAIMSWGVREPIAGLVLSNTGRTALAAWMKMERLLPAADPSRVPPGTFPGGLRDYNLARSDYLGYQRSEAQNTAPGRDTTRIPATFLRVTVSV